jgi:hypothetical protein
MLLDKTFTFTSAWELSRFVVTSGSKHDSRIGLTYEELNSTIHLDPLEISYRPGMVRRLGIVEILQFWSGYFDERHIKKAVPSLAYPYGHANAYGQKVSQQLPHVIDQLTDHHDTRRAILHIGKPEDGQERTKPCMQSIQFQIRGDCLHTTTYARSWDVLSGLPYDVILMSGVNQIMAKLLGVEPGMVAFHAASLHVYDEAVQRIGEKVEPGYKTPWNRMEIVRDFEDFDDVRDWAHDSLNSMDDWVYGLPEGIVCYHVE